MPRKRSFGYVRKLPSGRFQASYVAPNGLRRTAPKTFLTKTDAGKWLDRMRASIEEGRWRDPLLGRELFVDYAERWITERPGLRPRTVDLYRWLLKRYLRPELERVRLADMTPLVVRRWRTHMLDAGVSETMVAKSYRLMRAVLNTAVDDDILDRNPCRIRGGGDENAAERPTLTARQVQQLSMAVPPRFSAFVAVKTYGTLRWGEITALQRRDIDLEEGSVRVQAAFTERSDGSLSLGPPKPAPASARSSSRVRSWRCCALISIPTSTTNQRRWCSPAPPADRYGEATSTSSSVGLRRAPPSACRVCICTTLATPATRLLRPHQARPPAT